MLKKAVIVLLVALLLVLLSLALTKKANAGTREICYTRLEIVELEPLVRTIVIGTRVFTYEFPQKEIVEVEECREIEVPEMPERPAFPTPKPFPTISL